MKAIVIHNYYQEYAGEDREYDNEVSLLKENGIDVVQFTASNTVVDNYSLKKWIGIPKNMVWSREIANRLRVVLEKEKPDIAHVHNTFFILSLAVYSVCREMCIPIVQTVQNYRMFCASGNFLRKGHVCEDCAKSAFAYPAILHRCYRSSLPQSSAVANLITLHRLNNTWNKSVTSFIAVTDFIREKMIQYGVSADKVVTKPNFLSSDPGLPNREGEFALFVGRLHEEKGIRTLLDACSIAKHVPVRFVGDGPLQTHLHEKVKELNLTNVAVIGKCEQGEVLQWMKKARFLVLPSLWYEGLPLTLVEAFACGVPVLASNIGSLRSLVNDRVNGLHFETGNSADLAEKMDTLWNDESLTRRMGREARKTYSEKYTAEKNFSLMMDIYESAISANTMSQRS